MMLALLLGSLSSHAIERPSWAGFYASRPNGEIDTNKFPYIKGHADRVQWGEMEPKPGVYEWSKMDAQIRNAAKGGYRYYFVLWTGPHSPEWIYENGVPKVACSGSKGKDSFPYYLDPNYIKFFHRFIGKLADHIASLPEAERNTFAFIQPAFGSTGDRQLYKGTPKDPKYKISAQQYLDFCSGATIRFYDAFNRPELKQIKFLFNVDDESEPGEQVKTKGEGGLGEQLYANWLRKSYTIDLRKQQFTIAVGYQANGEITQDIQLRPTFFGLNGKDPEFVRGEFSKFADSGIFKENPIWNYYWTAISTVDRGLDLWEVDYATIKTGKYDEGFAFANRYSYYKRPQTSPYAFIALRDVLDASDTVRFPEDTYGKAVQSNVERVKKIESEFNKYGAKVGDLDAATSLKGAAYLLQAKAMNDVGFGLIARNYGRFITQIDVNKTSVGLWRVGPSDQPYGRYARAFEHKTGKDALYFGFHKDFFKQDGNPTGPLTFRVVWYDNTTGSWGFSYDAGKGNFNSAKTFTGTGTNRWREETFTITDAVMNHNGPRGADIALVNLDDKDKIFHLIEVQRGAAEALSAASLSSRIK
ncbi:MAG: hypothetical protein WCK57_00275 [Verrucomicrobiae bacterium]